ncbi:sulfurtransferase [Vibrio sp. S11_S32]|uniref:sulfurtransferase n=1 Tax=Vibrio sp. S11_S32 TaxID=2720225 RepID=UPI00167FF13D|nr:sulfurtransferase [Vibrio sp. S11_S32]MBD1577130.1 sulfurtransferase [Vibrio sp. S11_S32]
MNSTHPMVTPTWLFDHFSDDNVIVLDATTIDAVAGEALQGARRYLPNSQAFDIEKVFVDLDNPLPNTMPSPEKFTQQAQTLGINQDSIVVIYDERGLYSAPRAWWMFQCMGHAQVYVLNGGVNAWQAMGYPITDTHGVDLFAKGNFVAKYQAEKVYSAQDVLAVMDKLKTLIVDVRGEGRFNGTMQEPREGMRSGHIPSSINLPFGKVLVGHQYLPSQELTALLREYHFDQADKLIFSCGSGLTACIVLLAAYSAGYTNLALYDGSWSEWGADHSLPISQ